MHLVSNPVVVFVLLTSDWIRTTHFAKAWISQSVPCKWACAMQRFSGRHPIEMRLHCCTNCFQSITMQWNIDNKDQPNPAGMSCSIRLKCRAGLDVLTALVVFTETWQSQADVGRRIMVANEFLLTLTMIIVRTISNLSTPPWAYCGTRCNKVSLQKVIWRVFVQPINNVSFVFMSDLTEIAFECCLAQRVRVLLWRVKGITDIHHV